MKTTVLLLALALAHTAAHAAAIYECTDRSGRKLYSQDGGKNCKTSNLGRPSVYTSAPVYRHETPAAEQEPSAGQTLPPADTAAAERELQQAQKALEEGKNIRLGNERNYAKYLERVQGLENQVKAAQDKVKAAQGSASEEGLLH